MLGNEQALPSNQRGEGDSRVGRAQSPDRDAVLPCDLIGGLAVRVARGVGNRAYRAGPPSARLLHSIPTAPANGPSGEHTTRDLGVNNFWLA